MLVLLLRCLEELALDRGEALIQQGDPINDPEGGFLQDSGGLIILRAGRRRRCSCGGTLLGKAALPLPSSLYPFVPLSPASSFPRALLRRRACVLLRTYARNYLTKSSSNFELCSGLQN